MKYVLDANVALKWVSAEPDSAKAKALRDDFKQAIHELLAPDIFPVEIAHALTRAERQGRIKIGDCAVFLADVLASCPKLHSYLSLLQRATVSTTASGERRRQDGEEPPRGISIHCFPGLVAVNATGETDYSFTSAVVP